MRILFIGEQSLQNDAILKVLKSEVSQEIRQTTPERLKNDGDKLPDDNYQYIILDLISLSVGSDVHFKRMMQSKKTGYLIGISDHRSDLSIKQTEDFDIDYHFSLDSDTAKLLRILIDSGGSES